MDKKKEPQRKVSKEFEKANQSESFKGIVRIAGKDVRGDVRLSRALLVVKGISHTLSVAVSNVIKSELDISPDKLVGELTDEEIEKIDKILFNISAHNIPKFLLNRQHDVDDGLSKHYVMTDLLFSTKQDIEKEKKLYTWHGYRHAYGQKVRGQRTRNTGRTGMAVGVLRKSIIAAQQAATAPAGKPGAVAAATPAAGAAAPAAGAKAAPATKPAEKPAAKPAEKK